MMMMMLRMMMSQRMLRGQHVENSNHVLVSVIPEWRGMASAETLSAEADAQAVEGAPGSTAEVRRGCR